MCIVAVATLFRSRSGKWKVLQKQKIKFLLKIKESAQLANCISSSPTEHESDLSSILMVSSHIKWKFSNLTSKLCWRSGINLHV